MADGFIGEVISHDGAHLDRFGGFLAGVRILLSGGRVALDVAAGPNFGYRRAGGVEFASRPGGGRRFGRPIFTVMVGGWWVMSFLHGSSGAAPPKRVTRRPAGDPDDSER